MNQPPKRRPGRPLKENPAVRAHVDVILSPDLRKRVRMAAAARDMAMGEWVRRAIEEKLTRDST
jgi:predicted HicB family RNase H-like nuclease